MLSTEELVAAIAMAQAVGHRRHGHYDHNANSLIGPQQPPAERAIATVSPTVGHARLSVHYDPDTGEPLYSVLAVK